MTENESPQDEASATVSIKGPGVDISRPVDTATMSSVITLLFGGVPAGSAAPSSSAAPIVAAPQSPSPNVAGQHDDDGAGSTDLTDLTIGEFLEESGAKTFPHKICAAGYYLMKAEGEDSFNREMIRAALERAHEEMPGNFSRDFRTAASLKLIGERSEGGMFHVTSRGRRAVETDFTDVPKARPRRAPRKATEKNGDEE